MVRPKDKAHLQGKVVKCLRKLAKALNRMGVIRSVEVICNAKVMSHMTGLDGSSCPPVSPTFT